MLNKKIKVTTYTQTTRSIIPMSTNSLVTDIVVLVQYVRSQHVVVSQLSQVEKSHMLDILEDVISQANLLMSSMLASPLTGRMFVRSDIGLTPEIQADSLHRTLLEGI